jgi:hypothetical protein
MKLKHTNRRLVVDAASQTAKLFENHTLIKHYGISTAKMALAVNQAVIVHPQEN